MFARRSVLGRNVVGGLFLAAVGVWLIPGSQSSAQPPAPLPVDSGAAVPGQEVLTQGPVHEAFAEPTSQNPVAPLVVPKQPPNPVEEMPPDMKPQGDNVVWVPGYWAWDDSRADFLWISGIWRDAPPQHVWVPGYWSQTQGGFQWTPGVWTAAAAQQVSYLPDPPQSLEVNGPSTPAPSANDFWVPGNWQYNETRYVWRPGYWTAAQSDWIWIPAHYVWSPSGYLFLPGHWDYTLERRGVLFAPVYFSGGYYRRPGFLWGPSIVIDPGVLTASFFVRPGYCHYYFGDCYGPRYVALGFRPWFSVGVGFGYDPLFTYYRWYNVRRDPQWAVRLNDQFVYYNGHPEARPPRTYAESARVGFAVGGVSVALSFNKYVSRPAPAGHGPAVHFTNVSVAQRESISRDAGRSNDVARERARMETAPGGRPGTGGAPTNRTMDLGRLSQAGGGKLPGARVAVGDINHDGVPDRRAPGSFTPGGTPGGRTPSGITGGTPSGTPSGRYPSGTTGGNPSGTPSGRTPGGNPSGTPGGRTPGGTSGGNPSGTPSGRSPGGNPSGNPGGNPSGRNPGGPSGKPTDPKAKDPNSGKFLYSPLQDPNSNALHRVFGDRPKSPADGKAAGAATASGSASTDKATGGRAAVADAKADKGHPQPATAPRNHTPSTQFGRETAAAEPADAAAAPDAALTKDPIRPLTLSPYLTNYPPSGGRTVAAASVSPPPQGKDPIRPLTLIPQGSGLPSVGAAARANGGAVTGAPLGKDPIGPLNLVSPPAPFGSQGPGR